jgi:DNA-binding LytR/AlgR family response regulator
MNYLIVDDEPISHRIIEGYCAELSYLQKAGNAYNAFEAATIVTRKKIDLIFLDLNMPKMTGFDWLKTLNSPPKIIVTTAYQEYALEGYELNIVDYLLKPFSFPRFLKAVTKASTCENPEQSASSHRKEGEGHFFLKGDKKYHQIHTDDIRYVEAYGNYTKVFLAESMIISHEKISTLEKMLPRHNFLRVHKSFLIAIDKINYIQGNQIYLEDFKVPIGQTYRSSINQLLNGR